MIIIGELGLLLGIIMVIIGGIKHNKKLKKIGFVVIVLGLIVMVPSLKDSFMQGFNDNLKIN